MRRAFTLLEVMVALGILALGLMVLVESQGGAVMMTTESHRIMTATILAQEKMANAPNHTTVYIPVGANGMPLVYGPE